MKTVYRYTAVVLGMKCGMCEVHIEELIARNIDVRKVSAKRYKKQVVIETFSPLNEEKLESVMKESGYYYRGIINREVVVKKSLFEKLFKKK